LPSRLKKFKREAENSMPYVNRILTIHIPNVSTIALRNKKVLPIVEKGTQLSDNQRRKRPIKRKREREKRKCVSSSICITTKGERQLGSPSLHFDRSPSESPVM